MTSKRNASSGGPKKQPPSARLPTKILAIDIGGTKAKLLVSGETQPRKFASGKRMTPARLVESVRKLTVDWDYEAVSIGYPGLVGEHGPRSEPGNLAPGWVGFNFAAAFDLPVRITNDAAMQALGSYEGGRMLFLGLGTGLGSALIADQVIVPLELGQLMYKDGQTLVDVLGRRAFTRLGKTVWREAVGQVAASLLGAFVVDYIVLGGGNAKYIKELPPGTRVGNNLTAFRGGFRLWNVEVVPTLTTHGTPTSPTASPTEWRLI